MPERKSAKNRIHWDVVAPDVYALVAAGARILREPDDDIVWHVLADPEGNEFCAFSDEGRRRGSVGSTIVAARLDLDLPGPDITAQICDIPSVSGSEGAIADAIEAALRPLRHLRLVLL